MFLLFLGFISGILVNHLADCLPLHQSVWFPICTHCEKRQSLVAYLLDRKCRNCQYPKSIRFRLVICLTPILFLILPIAHFSWPKLWIVSAITTYFILILVMDIEHRLILNPLIIIGIFLGFLFGLESIGLIKSLMGGISALLIFIFTYYLGKKIIGLFGTKFHPLEIDDPIGFGDVYLAAIIGLVLGWPTVLLGLLVGVISAGIFSFVYLSIMLIQGNYRPFRTIPYGPFLILGMVFALVYS